MLYPGGVIMLSLGWMIPIWVLLVWEVIIKNGL